MVGHPAGGGGVTRYLARHGTAGVAKGVLLGAVPPLMLKTAANPEGSPIAIFDGLRDGVMKDRSQFYADLAIPFYSANRAGSEVSQGIQRSFWLWSMQAGHKSALDCIRAFSETDFTDDLPKIDIPVWVAHADDDQIVPIQAPGPKAAKLLPQATLTVYPGGSHGLHGEIGTASRWERG